MLQKLKIIKINNNYHLKILISDGTGKTYTHTYIQIYFCLTSFNVIMKIKAYA